MDKTLIRKHKSREGITRRTQKVYIRKCFSLEEFCSTFHFTYPKAVTCSLVKNGLGVLETHQRNID